MTASPWVRRGLSVGSRATGLIALLYLSKAIAAWRMRSVSAPGVRAACAPPADCDGTAGWWLRLALLFACTTVALAVAARLLAPHRRGDARARSVGEPRQR